MRNFPDKLTIGPDFILRSGMQEVTAYDMFVLYEELLREYRELQEKLVETQRKSIAVYDKYFKLLKEKTSL